MIRSLAQIAADAQAKKEAAQAHEATEVRSQPEPEKKQARRGRPCIGARPMTQSEMNARSRAKKREKKS